MARSLASGWWRQESGPPAPAPWRVGADRQARSRHRPAPAASAAARQDLPADGELEAAGFAPLGGIDTFWYDWAAVNADSVILR